ncbi:MAG: methyltransferase domain-containing protein [Rhizobiales bacterium]|nr:methyltransferase domain-containing protein [Hyphomicrobiales bacterium]
MTYQVATPGSADWAKAQDMVSRVPHWHHKFEIVPGLVTPGSYDPQFMLDKLQLPADMTGVRALDIGPSDGFFSMHMARRGAHVTAIDYRAKDAHGFGAMEALSGLTFEYMQMNLYDIDPSSLGEFDVVLFLGVLYHLPDMMRALDLISRLCRTRLFVETQYEPDLTPGVAVARYYEARTLAGDITNFWAPNRECLQAMLRDAGFRVDREDDWGARLLVDASVDVQQEQKKVRMAYGLMPKRG